MRKDLVRAVKIPLYTGIWEGVTEDLFRYGLAEIAFTSLHQEHVSNKLEINSERLMCYPSKSNF
jgi:hypothetical protein